jgi:hypothetical protein
MPRPLPPAEVEAVREGCGATLTGEGHINRMSHVLLRLWPIMWWSQCDVSSALSQCYHSRVVSLRVLSLGGYSPGSLERSPEISFCPEWLLLFVFVTPALKQRVTGGLGAKRQARTGTSAVPIQFAQRVFKVGSEGSGSWHSDPPDPRD